MRTHNQGISSDTLKDTYSLAFSKVTDAIIQHYRAKVSGYIGLIVRANTIVIMRDGKPFETIRLNQIDELFKSIDIQELRKNLKKM